MINSADLKVPASTVSVTMRRTLPCFLLPLAVFSFHMDPLSQEPQLPLAQSTFHMDPLSQEPQPGGQGVTREGVILSLEGQADEYWLLCELWFNKVNSPQKWWRN